jgi:hypothetical protein
MKQPLRVTIVGITWMLASSIVIAPTPGAAAPSYSGTITGFFDSPVLSGAFLQAGTHLPVVRDNTSTAGGSGIGTSSVSWGGDDNGGPVAPSTLTFTGNSFSNVGPGQVFPLGTLTYFNGPSGPASLIFGVTMHLSAGDGITPFAGPVAIVSTQNGNIDRVADADVLFFSTFEIPSTLAAFEGTAVTAIIYAKIVGDSQLEITSMSLAPDEASHGCVDEGPLDSTGPCASACGDTCGAIALALARPLCAGEGVPAVLNRRLDHARQLLRRAAQARSAKRAQQAVARVMKHLERSAGLARAAAGKGTLSPSCANGLAQVLAESHAER